ncbi:MAG: hypothetical protein ACKO6C_05655, partial [Alphaproteobacteria bacterium]
MKNFIKNKYRFPDFFYRNNKIKKLGNFSKKKKINQEINNHNKGKFLIIFFAFYLNILFFSYQ